MSTLYSFPPLANADSRMLILGSMPGKASLAAQQYYAHPRNAFWKIMASLFQFSEQAEYATRVHALLKANIAVWDVLHSCERPGSLDSSIVEDSIVANDFAHFFRHHRQIKQVFFNGGKAESAFKKYVLPTLPRNHSPTFLRLPSTSPAHAALSFEKKLMAWRKHLMDRGPYAPDALA